MEDYIIKKIQGIFSQVSNAGTGNLTLSPESFNKTIYDGILLIMHNAIMPIAYTLLSLFLLLELFNLTTRYEGMKSSMGIEMPAKLMFKAVVCKMVVDNAELILNAIFEMSTLIIKNINGVITGGNVLSPADMDTIRQQIEGMSFGAQLMTAVEVLIISFVVKFIMVLVTVIVVGRMIEIYIKMAFSPLPLSTFPNAELSGIGKNFLKDFTGVCLQGAIIYLIIVMFPLLLGNATMGDIGTDISDSLMTAAGYSIVLIICVFNSGKFAKQITNAM